MYLICTTSKSAYFNTNVLKNISYTETLYYYSILFKFGFSINIKSPVL